MLIVIVKNQPATDETSSKMLIYGYHQEIRQQRSVVIVQIQYTGCDTSNRIRPWTFTAICDNNKIRLIQSMWK